MLCSICCTIGESTWISTAAWCLSSEAYRNHRNGCWPRSISNMRWYVRPQSTTFEGVGNCWKLPCMPIAEKQKRLFNLRDLSETLPSDSNASILGGYGRSRSDGNFPLKQHHEELFVSVLSILVPHLEQRLFIGQFKNRESGCIVLKRSHQLRDSSRRGRTARKLRRKCWTRWRLRSRRCVTEVGCRGMFVDGNESVHGEREGMIL